METCYKCISLEGMDNEEQQSVFPHCVNQNAFPCFCGKALQENRENYIRIKLTKLEAKYIYFHRSSVTVER